MILIACEDKNDDQDGGSLVGIWELSNMGDYANADCSGEIDDAGWALASAFGLKATMEFASNGKGIYTPVSYTHVRAHETSLTSRMPSSA